MRVTNMFDMLELQINLFLRKKIVTLGVRVYFFRKFGLAFNIALLSTYEPTTSEIKVPPE